MVTISPGAASILAVRSSASHDQSASQTSDSIAMIRTKSACSVTSRSRTPSGRTGSRAISDVSPMTTVSASSGTKP